MYEILLKYFLVGITLIYCIGFFIRFNIYNYIKKKKSLGIYDIKKDLGIK